MNVLLWIGIILVILWLLGFTTFQAAGGLIHILLVVAIIVLILWFIRGRAAPPSV
ncbi:MAG: lmo0937 family membrane protein [Longimicrobiales bacterium]